MAENEVLNNENSTPEVSSQSGTNPSIEININNNINGDGGRIDASVIAVFVEFIRQSGINNQEIKDMLSNLDSLATVDDIKALNDKETKRIRSSIYYARNTIVARLEELLSNTNFASNKEEIDRLFEVLGGMDKKIEDTFGEVADEVKTINGKQTKSLRTTIYNARDRILEKIESLNPSADLTALKEDLTSILGLVGGFDSKVDDAVGLITDETKDISDRQTKGIRSSIYNARDRIISKIEALNPSADLTALREDLSNFVSLVEGAIKDSTKAETVTAETLRSLVETVASLEKRVGELASGLDKLNHEKDDDGKDDDTDDKDKDDDGKDDDKDDDKNKKRKPTPKPKLKKLNFVQKSLQQTKILSEPKQPWYKRFATFAIKHPVLSVVVGAGLGLGLFGATCGIAAVAGGTGFLTATNMLLPSIPGFAGIGAVGGGAISVASNTIPKGKWGLVAKASRQFNKVKKIDRKKQWVASYEKKQEAAKIESREKHRNSRGLVRKLKVHRKLAKVHKLAERTAKKLRRLYGRKLEKATTRVLKTKSKLNVKEIKSGKTQAIAGYLYKKRKAERQFAEGKIDEEELEDRLTDYEEDVADLDGGEPGLNEVGNQYTFDSEALDAIERADSEGKNSAFQAVKQDILNRNARETRTISTKVVLDPEYLESVIAEMKANGETENLAKYEEELARIKAQAEEAKRVATEEGIDNFNPLEDMSEEEVAAWEEENGIQK